MCFRGIYFYHTWQINIYVISFCKFFPKKKKKKKKKGNKAPFKLIENWLVKRQRQLRDALQLISAFSISHGRRQSTQCGARRVGGRERPVPTPPAHGIKDTASGAHIRLQHLFVLQNCLVLQWPVSVQYPGSAMLRSKRCSKQLSAYNGTISCLLY